MPEITTPRWAKQSNAIKCLTDRTPSVDTPPLLFSSFGSGKNPSGPQLRDFPIGENQAAIDEHPHHAFSQRMRFFVSGGLAQFRRIEDGDVGERADAQFTTVTHMKN